MRTVNRVNGKKVRTLDGLAVFEGLVIAFVLLIIVSFLLAILALLFDWQASTGLLNVITHACVLVGAVFTGRRCTCKAWLNGILLGIVSLVLITWFGANKSFLTWLWFQRLFSMGFVAMLGAILGGFH
ncbi:MAG: TIGR04086 family membrane protein [Firmicutes bacterium]|nr:TIGR04086 family membrane protein [Bacillota bacterium]